MPSIDGGDSTSKDYAPHMYIGDHFIHQSGKTMQVGECWYRAGRISDESFVAERWKGHQYYGDQQTDREEIPADQIPAELLEKLATVTRAGQYMLQAEVERLMNP